MTQHEVTARSRACLGRARRMAVLAAAAVVLVGCDGSAVAPSAPPASPAPTSGVAAQSDPPATTEPTAPISLSPSPEAGINLLVLGDSIPIKEMGCGSTCAGFDELYAAYLEERLGLDVTVSNMARPNARVATLADALEEDVVREAVAAADIVIVSIGYNDEPPRTEADAPCRVEEPPPGDDGSATIKAALTYTQACIDATMDWYEPSLDAVYGTIETLASGRPQVRVTTGVFNNWIGHPAFDTVDLPASDKSRAIDVSIAMKDAWNERDCQLATGHGFDCADMYHAFNGPAGDQPIEPFVVADYVHLNADGHARVAALLEAIDLSVLQ